MMRILLWPHPMLKAVCSPVLELDTVYAAELRQMEEACRDAGGLGLSANQVGLSKRILVVRTPLGFRGFINPKILEFPGAWYQAQEGCLSLPGIVSPARRNTRAIVEHQPPGKPWPERKVEAFEGQLAHILQHEIEHLDGKMMIDRLPPGQRDQIRAYMKKVSRGGGGTGSWKRGR
jgi:peptide deformylase